MISRKIDGSQVGGASHLFGLIEILSDPVAYSEKLKKLQEEADRNQKFVELVGPADKISQLKDGAELALKKAEEAISAAKNSAIELFGSAQKKANDIVAEAEKKSASLLAEAAKAKTLYERLSSEADKKFKELSEQSKKLESSLFDAAKDSDALKAKIAAADQSKKEYDSLREEIVKKHQSFLTSVT